MNILKSNLSKFFFFPAVWPSIGVILICLGMSSFLGMKIPELLIQFPRNYEHKDLFLQTMKVFGLFIFGVYVIRSIYQLCLNKYIKLVIAETRNLVFKKWLLFKKVFLNK